MVYDLGQGGLCSQMWPIVIGLGGVGWGGHATTTNVNSVIHLGVAAVCAEA